MNISMKKSLLGMVGAIALTGFEVAQAAPVVYAGTTALTTGGGLMANCTLTLTGDIDSSGVVTVTGAGATGASPCDLIKNGTYPWTGDTSTSSISTGAYSSVIYAGAVLDTCGGNVTGVVYNYTAGDPLPTSVDINTAGASGNYGGACTISGSLTRVLP